MENDPNTDSISSWYLLQMPKTKLKYAKNGLFSIGVTLYNELPTKTRKVENFNAFRKDVVNLYMSLNWFYVFRSLLSIKNF